MPRFVKTVGFTEHPRYAPHEIRGLDGRTIATGYKYVVLVKPCKTSPTGVLFETNILKRAKTVVRAYVEDFRDMGKKVPLVPLVTTPDRPLLTDQDSGAEPLNGAC